MAEKESEVARLRREWQEENRLIYLMLRAHMVETDRRFADVGREMTEMGADFADRLKKLGEAMAESFSTFGERLTRESANNEERYNQLFGRMRLQDNRFNAFLGASDTQWSELERRVSEIERRLGPPAA